MAQVRALVRKLDPTGHKSRSCMLQLRSKIPHAATKTEHSQKKKKNPTKASHDPQDKVQILREVLRNPGHTIVWNLDSKDQTDWV